MIGARTLISSKAGRFSSRPDSDAARPVAEIRAFDIGLNRYVSWTHLQTAARARIDLFFSRNGAPSSGAPLPRIKR